MNDNNNRIEYISVKYNKQVANFYDIGKYLSPPWVIITIGYICLSLWFAESTSILPFSGGAFGFVGVTLGSYMGYIVAVCESFEYILYVSAFNFSLLGLIVIALFNMSDRYSPLLWLLFYAISLGFHLEVENCFILSVIFWQLCQFC